MSRGITTKLMVFLAHHWGWGITGMPEYSRQALSRSEISQEAGQPSNRKGSDPTWEKSTFRE